MNRHFSLAIACLLTCLSGMVSAAHDEHHFHESDAHEHHDHKSKHHDDEHDDHHGLEQKAHLHGLAELTLVIEGEALEIELESPAANIVGFEHKAKSKEQIAAVEKARELLESSKDVFAFSGGDCEIQQVSADLDALGHHDGHSEHHESEHSEVTASYRFQCPQANQLESVSVNLMALFPGIETLKVQWITEQHQGAVDLNQHSNRIVFK